MTSCKRKKLRRRSMAVTEKKLEDVQIKINRSWDFPATGLRMDYCSIQEICFLLNIVTGLSLHFMEAGTGRHCHKLDITLYLFLLKMASLQVNMRFLPMVLREQIKLVDPVKPGIGHVV